VIHGFFEKFLGMRDDDDDEVTAIQPIALFWKVGREQKRTKIYQNHRVENRTY
jgi:hypothetical protein